MQEQNTIFEIDKGLCITPALDIIFRLPENSQSGLLLDSLIALLEKLDAFPFGNKKCFNILFHDQDVGIWQGAMTPDILLKIRDSMKKASTRKIRKKQTLFKISLEEVLTSKYIDDLSISLNKNTFPDQPCIVSLQLSTSRDDAWEHLQFVRNRIITEFEPYFFWATLGYKFIMDPFNSLAVKNMQANCLRYYGADLQDILSVHNASWWEKLRTINWQTTVNFSASQNVNGNMSPNIFNFQTGEHPSICDCYDANPANRVLLLEYKALAEKLSSLILQTDDLIWADNWESDIYSRWAVRWQRYL